MKHSFLLLQCLLFPFCSVAQTPHHVITAVQQAQRALHTVSYTLQRTDTLLNGVIRHMSGHVMMQVARQDSLYGFYWWSQKDGEAQARVYNGHMGFELDTVQQIYRRVVQPTSIRQLGYSGGGGHLLVPDLVHLDTTTATDCTLTQDARFYYLTFHYADLPQEGGVTNRYKRVTIDRITRLPVAVRRHQESMGRVQDLTYQVKLLQQNNQAPSYDFTSLSFLKTYRQQVEHSVVSHSITPPLLGHAASFFRLHALDGSIFTLAELHGQVVLLDFWEVSCGPCIASLPELQRLHEQYGPKGLRVFGITHEPDQTVVAKRLLTAQNITFPTLLGTVETKQAYQLTAIPHYAIINRQGNICFLQDGFSPALEIAIQEALQQ